jgi:hypothetical protein
MLTQRVCHICRSCGMWYRVFRWVVHKVAIASKAFTFRFKQFKKKIYVLTSQNTWICKPVLTHYGSNSFRRSLVVPQSVITFAEFWGTWNVISIFMTHCRSLSAEPHESVQLFLHSFVMHFNIILLSKGRFTKFIINFMNSPMSSACPVILFILFDHSYVR